MREPKKPASQSTETKTSTNVPSLVGKKVIARSATKQKNIPAPAKVSKSVATKTPSAKRVSAAKKPAAKPPSKAPSQKSGAAPGPAQPKKRPPTAKGKALKSVSSVLPPLVSTVLAPSIVEEIAKELDKVEFDPRPISKARVVLTEVTPLVPKPAAKPVQPPFEPPTLPPFLFEDDQLPPVSQRGPGYRYALIPQGVTAASNIELPNLPESYGTGRIHLTARDPEWLHADWDLSTAQLKAANSASSTGHLSLRVRRIDGKESGNVTDIALLPDSRHWFIHIGEDNCECQVSLGYTTKTGNWVEMATSKQVTTPRRGATHDFKSLFITKDVAPLKEISPIVVADTPEVFQPSPSEPEVVAHFTKFLDADFSVPSFPPAENAAPNDLPPPIILDTTMPHRKSPRSELDIILDTWWEEALADGSASLAGLLAAPGWSAAQAEALASLLRIDEEKRVWLGSMELTRELLARHAESNLETASSIQLSERNAAVMAESSPSNSRGIGGGNRSFWFKVNAELVIYGSVASGAQVRIGSRPLHLRPDNTFTQRFILPDGAYTLPVEAESADGVETRFATLHFVRNSEYGGEVNPHPQDSALKPPRVENVVSAN